jgi:hypothetical protein
MNGGRERGACSTPHRPGALHCRGGRRLRLRLRDRRLGLRWFGGGPAPGREGLLGVRPRARSAVGAGRLPAHQLEPGQGAVDAGRQVLRHPAAVVSVGRVRAVGIGRRRRLAGLRQHALRPARPGVRGPSVARPRRLEGRAGAALSPRPVHARRDPARGRGGARPGAGPGRRAPRPRRQLRPDPGRRVPRRARPDRRRSVLRRRRAGPHRLHAVRRLHGRLPAGGQEHPRQELPVVRRAARGRGAAAAPGRRRRRPPRRRLRDHPPRQRRVAGPRSPGHDRAPGGAGGRGPGHRRAAPAQQGPRLAASAVRRGRPHRAHQQRGHPRRDLAAQGRALRSRPGDHLVDPRRRRHPRRGRALQRRLRRPGAAVDAPDRRRRSGSRAGCATSATSSATRSTSRAACGPSAPRAAACTCW